MQLMKRRIRLSAKNIACLMALIMLFPVVGLAAPGTVQAGTDIWTPIGSSTNQFGGLFDGGSIDNAVNRAVIYASGGAIPGGIAGIFDLAGDCATISRCFNTAEIKAYQYAGGIVGSQFANNVTISACYNSGAVTGTSSGKTYAGGITGLREKAGTDVFKENKI